jgi:hexosaminidase
MHKRLCAVAVLSAAALSSCTHTVSSQKPSVPAQAATAPPLAPVRTLIPAPAAVEAVNGPPFVVGPTTRILVPPGDAAIADVGRYLSDFIGLAAGPTAPAVQPAADPVPSGSIVLSLRGHSAGYDESYELTVSSDRAEIVSSSPAGLFYAVQTLRQLMPAFVEYEAVRADESQPVTIPAVHIVDRPRFPWRGAMLDVARHFMQVDEVKRYIDLMALYKLNRLHLHLADDQGWRVEIAARPNLTVHGGTTEVGGGPGGFYTKEQFAALVAYARARFVTIVPEIDMPGHTNAALASYVELNCNGVAPPLYTGIDVGFSAFCVDKEPTYAFIDDVVREIAAMSPGPYFHVGGDEVKTLTPEQYARFIERVQGIVQSHGKYMIGWDEIAPVKLLPTTIVQHWRPKTSPREAIARGNKVILSPADKIYLDMKYDRETPIGLTWAAIVEVRDAYDWDPATLLEGVPEASIVGVEAALWTETVANIRDVEFLAFPRLAGVAEIGWSPAARRDWNEYRARLGAHARRWSALGLNFYRSPQVPWRD